MQNNSDDESQDGVGNSNVGAFDDAALVAGQPLSDAPFSSDFIPDREHGLTPRKMPVMWNGKLKRDSIENTIICIEEKFPKMFCLNEFSDEIFMVKCPSWENVRTFKPRPYNHTDVVQLSGELERFGLNTNNKRTEDAIKVVSRRFSVHPVRSRMDKMVWDGTPRLSGWLKEIFGSEQDKDYLSFIGTAWMVAGVSRIYEPGKKFDHILILEGPESRGKSSAFRILSTFGGWEYVCDTVSFSQIGQMSSILMMQGKIIIEFQELDGLNKKDDTELKKWITLTEDRIQKKYENPITNYKRQFIIGGTTNKDTYLKDETGNRRFWPVKANSADLGKLWEIKDQLWAEAVQLYKDGYKIYLKHDDPIFLAAKLEQAGRMSTDPWHDAIEKIVGGTTSIKIETVLKEIEPHISKHDSRMESRVRRILKILGFESKVVWEHGKSKRIWTKAVKPHPLNDAPDIQA